ncbi:MAG TPA: DUF2079 domain-containing protein [Actinospica sp.]|jgi:uncharacterized membrane protein|nr:DUF2079 domain-containing protein [Actinospica sp.]
MDVDVTATPTVGEPAETPAGSRAWSAGIDRHVLGATALAAAAALLYALYSYLRFRQQGYFGWDLGIFDQTVRAYAHFHLPHVTSMRHDSATDPGKLEWTDHFSPILALLAPLYWVSNSAYNLLLAQAVLFAAAALPVFAFSRRRLGVLPGYLVAGVYLLYWPLQSALAFDFHEAAFAPLLTALLIERADARRWRQAAVAAGLLLLVKEDMGQVVLMLGVWIMIRARRGERRELRIGAYFAVAGLAAMALIIEVLMPLEGGNSMRDWQYDDLGATPGKAAAHLLEHPSLFVTELIDPHVKVATVLWLMLPVLFLCLRSWLLLLAVPPLIERYFAADPFYWIRDYHYNAFLAAIIVLAAVDGASKFRWPKLRLGWAVAALAVSVALLPRFPLWQLTGHQLWHSSGTVHAQERLLDRLPAGTDILVPWPTDPYTDGRVNPINTDYTQIAPPWMLTADLPADVAALNRSLPAGSPEARYVPYASDGGWMLARLASP